MTTRRAAKKTHRAEVQQVRAAVGDARPCPPSRHIGVLLAPEGYVGWILITTPSGRRKVRWLAASGHVFRDDRCRRGGFWHVRVHAANCRVEPCMVSALLVTDPPLTLTASGGRTYADHHHRGLAADQVAMDETAGWSR